MSYRNYDNNLAPFSFPSQPKRSNEQGSQPIFSNQPRTEFFGGSSSIRKNNMENPVYQSQSIYDPVKSEQGLAPFGAIKKQPWETQMYQSETGQRPRDSRAPRDSPQKSIFAGLDIPRSSNVLNTSYGVEGNVPVRSLTPQNVQQKPSLYDNFLDVNDRRNSNVQIFQNPVYTPQGSISRDPGHFQFEPLLHKKPIKVGSVAKSPPRSVKSYTGEDNLLARPSSAILRPSQGVLSNVQGQSQGQGQPQPRPSTVVQVDPYAKLTGLGHQPYFADKRVIVTGASSGIGRAVAMWFLNSGARVALIGRDLESLINIGKQFPNQALAIKCDLSKDDQPYDMYNTVITELKGVDILVNAAGVFREGDIKTMQPQDFDNIMDVNLRSVFYLSYLFYPALQKSNGCVINISCQYGSKPFAGLYAYCMSKAGVEALTKHLACQFAKTGVRVNAVSPGIVETNMFAYRNIPEDEIKQIYGNAEFYTPLKRIASIDDVGKAIIFLCSQAAAHITGQILNIDGGRGLTSSGWHQWQGAHSTNLVVESKESVFTSLKGLFKETADNIRNYNEAEKIGLQIKKSAWSSTNREAHASVKHAQYHEQDIRNDPRVSVMAMENTFQKIFN